MIIATRNHHAHTIRETRTGHWIVETIDIDTLQPVKEPEYRTNRYDAAQLADARALQEDIDEKAGQPWCSVINQEARSRQVMTFG